MNEAQKKRAIEVMEEYIHARPDENGRTHCQIETELDAKRMQLINSELKPLIDSFLSGKIKVADFKSRIDSLNKQNNYWGFTGINGQMFFNMLVNTANDIEKCEQELRAAITIPPNEDSAQSRIRTFHSFVKRVGDEHLEQGGSKASRPRVGSIPLFLSYFWQLQVPTIWPVYYTASIQVLEDLNLWAPVDDLAESYIQFKKIHEELIDLYQRASGNPFTFYDVEHVFWIRRQTSSSKAARGSDNLNISQKIVQPQEVPEKLPESYVPPIVSIISRMSINDPTLESAARSSGISLEKAFEKSIHAAFTILGYKTEQMGQGKGRVPDGVALDFDNTYGIIWDAKIRQNGYGMGTDDRAIREYIITQSRELKRKQTLRNIYYAIISSSFLDDYDDIMRSLKMDTDINEVCLVEAEAIVAMVELKLRDPLQISLGPDGIQRLFSSSGILKAEDVRALLG